MRKGGFFPRDHSCRVLTKGGAKDFFKPTEMIENDIVAYNAIEKF